MKLLRNIGHGKPGFVNGLVDVFRGIRSSLVIPFQREQGLSQRVLSFGPHSAELYLSVIDRLKKDIRIHFVLAKDVALGHIDSSKVNLVLRHDMDSEPNKVCIFTDVEKRLGLRSSIYLRVDGESYDPADISKTLQKLRSDGFEIGLHTAVYKEPNACVALNRELEKFRSIMGFEAQTFNTHGVYPTNFRTRLKRVRFLYDCSVHRTVPDLCLVDHNTDDAYDYLIGDSQHTRDRKANFLTNDILDVGNRPKGQRVLFMTHPAYWTINP